MEIGVCFSSGILGGVEIDPFVQLENHVANAADCACPGVPVRVILVSVSGVLSPVHALGLPCAPFLLTFVALVPDEAALNVFIRVAGKHIVEFHGLVVLRTVGDLVDGLDAFDAVSKFKIRESKEHVRVVKARNELHGIPQVPSCLVKPADFYQQYRVIVESVSCFGPCARISRVNSDFSEIFDQILQCH